MHRGICNAHKGVDKQFISPSSEARKVTKKLTIGPELSSTHCMHKLAPTSNLMQERSSRWRSQSPTIGTSNTTVGSAHSVIILPQSNLPRRQTLLCLIVFITIGAVRPFAPCGRSFRSSRHVHNMGKAIMRRSRIVYW